MNAEGPPAAETPDHVQAAPSPAATTYSDPAGARAWLGLLGPPLGYYAVWLLFRRIDGTPTDWRTIVVTMLGAGTVTWPVALAIGCVGRSAGERIRQFCLADWEPNRVEFAFGFVTGTTLVLALIAALAAAV